MIGNGPSLSRQDIGPLESQVTFAMNAFWKHPIIREWNPTYYCFADLVFFDGSAAASDFFESLVQRVTESTFLLPLWTRPIVDPLFSDRSRYYLPIDDRFVAGPGISHVDLEKTRPQSIVNTSLVCLLAAIYMGCSRIYLLGMDHDWLAHRDLDRHFYPGVTLEGHETSELNAQTTSFGYGAWMRSTLWLWEDYASLKRIAEARGIQILNATDGGFLDVFERVSYDSVMPKVSK